jgi:hypothetical protein
MTLRIGVIALGFAVTTATAAEALTIDPQCEQMRDKVACTCALQNGGTVGPDKHRGGMWWKAPKGNVFGFRQCTTANGE